MNANEHPACDRAELVHDYAFDEIAPMERQAMERHLTSCAGCAAELDRLRLTTAVLRVLPDVEVPRRIAFVSDKALEPKQGWLAGFWNSASRLGFASACVLAAGLSYAAAHRQPEVRTVVQTGGVSQAQVDTAVTKAVAQAVERTRAEDSRITQAALDAVDQKYASRERELLIAMQQDQIWMQKKAQVVAKAAYMVSQ